MQNAYSMNAKPDPSIGQNIRRERKRRKLTGEDVRRLAGIDPTSLSFFERGKREPRLYHLRRLAKAFDVPIARLLREGR